MCTAPDPPNRLKNPEPHKLAGSGKGLARTTPIPVDDFKAMGKKLGNATINEILMTVATMTLRAYFEKYEPETLQVENCKVSLQFPIDMRPQDADMLSEEWFGNKMSAGSLQCPVLLDDPRAILKDIKAQSEHMKISPEPYVRKNIVDCFASRQFIAPAVKATILLDKFSQVTGMLSNIKGPSEEAQFAGQAIDDLEFIVLGPLGLYIGILSYKGMVHGSICSDASCEPDPYKLANEWAPAFQRLCDSCGN